MTGVVPELLRYSRFQALTGTTFATNKRIAYYQVHDLVFPPLEVTKKNLSLLSKHQIRLFRCIVQELSMCVQKGIVRSFHRITITTESFETISLNDLKGLFEYSSL